MNQFPLKITILTVWLTIISHFLAAQTLLQGLVTDAVTGKPLPFATVYINTTTRGTTASENGNYKLTGIPAGTVEVVASYLGYKQAKSFVKLRPSVSTTVNLALSPTGNSLADVTVTAKRSKAWERLFRRFKSELLGDSPFTGRCVIVNERAVILTEEDNHLRAKATEPLVIENNALGYRIHYDMLWFDYFERATYYGGASRFEELTPENPQQQKRWQRNRQLAYTGSVRHLIASMIAKTHEQEGYMVYQSNIDLTGRSAPMVPVLIFEGDRPPVAQMDSIFRQGELPNERQLVLNGPLEIFYTRANVRNSPYRDMPYAYSLLVLPNKTALVTTDGWIPIPNGMEIRGYLSKDRLANLLPADWRPASAIAPPQTLADGTILPPDGLLDTLKRDWRSYQKTILPTVYLHTDKAFYTTGDALWYSGYVLNPTTYALMPNRYADVDETLHLDWLSPSGQTLYHQWVPVKNGRTEGTFKLPDSLQTGAYTLRAYTEAGRVARRPTFEKTILVSNGLSSAVSTSTIATNSQPETGTQPTGQNQPDAGGLSLGVTADTTGIAVKIQTSGAELDQPVYLTVQSRERFVGQAKIKPQKGVAQVMIPAINIPPGLVRLALFDRQGRPWAERLVTVSTSDDLMRVGVTADKPHYAPRDSVKLQIRLQDETGNPLPAYLSASVTDADQLPTDSLVGSLPAHLLASATHGPLDFGTATWRNPSLPNAARPNAARPDSSVGIVMRGRVIDRKDRIVPKAKILISFVGKDAADSFARSTMADEQGHFQIDGMALTDTAQLLVQVMDEAFKPIKARVQFDSPTGPLGVGAEHSWPVNTNNSPNWSHYLAAVRAARLRQADFPERYRFSDARQLKEVVVKAAKIEDDSEARRVSLHGMADATAIFKDGGSQYTNVYEMMRGRLPGVQVNSRPMSSGYSVVVRGVGTFGGNNAPLYIWNGQYIEENGEGTALFMINPSEIERIELVKNSGASIYGSRGGAGVIALFSRKWKPAQFSEGADKVTVVGFPSPHSFTITMPDSTRIDRRDVLLWQPQLQTDAQGQVMLNFPLSDVVRTLRVTVQGVTASGQPVSVERLIRVQ